jgi:2'-5' RNA ligase
VRLFCALELGDDVHARLQSFVRRLKHDGGPRFTGPRQWHVTTKFLGEVPDDAVATVVTALQHIERRGRVDGSVRGVGFFPDARRPRVFWAGVTATTGLRRLAEATEQLLAAECGIAPDLRPFAPHVTLCRLRSPQETQVLRNRLAAVDEAELDFGAIVADSFALYGSVPVDGLHRHTELARFSLLPETPAPPGPPA